MSSSSEFVVNIFDMAGGVERITSSSDMHVSELISKIRQTRPNSEKNTHIKLFFTMPETNKYKRLDLYPDKTLGEMGINEDAFINVFYNDPLTPSCIRPLPHNIVFHDQLHTWIEEKDAANRIDFKDPFEFDLATVKKLEHEGKLTDGVVLGEHKASRNMTLLINHNKWQWDADHLFFLTNTQFERFRITTKQYSDTMGSNVEYTFNEWMAYPEQKDHIMVDLELLYRENGQSQILEPSNQKPTLSPWKTITVPNYSSIIGKLDSAYISIVQTYGTRKYIRYCNVMVVLAGPIIIRDPDGKSLLILEDETAQCTFPYQMILMCKINGKIPVSSNALKIVNVQNPNNYINANIAGGRHRTKRSKRTKNKKNTRRH
jgi:hypothetical protein